MRLCERTDEPLGVSGTFLGPYASGAPAIFAWAAAQLGARVRFAGVCGDDPFGTLCRRQLGAAGVELHVRAAPDYETGAAFVSYDEAGDREFLFTSNVRRRRSSHPLTSPRNCSRV